MDTSQESYVVHEGLSVEWLTFLWDFYDVQQMIRETWPLAPHSLSPVGHKEPEMSSRPVLSEPSYGPAEL